MCVCVCVYLYKRAHTVFSHPSGSFRSVLYACALCSEWMVVLVSIIQFIPRCFLLFSKNKTSTPVVSKNIISHKFAIKKKMRHSERNCTTKRIHHNLWTWANILNIFMNVKSATTKTNLVIDVPQFGGAHEPKTLLELIQISAISGERWTKSKL